MRFLAGWIGAVIFCVGCSGSTSRGQPMGTGGTTSGGGGGGGSSVPGGGSNGTQNQFLSELVTSTATKIDLLFMLDNSAGMAQKQELLKNSIPLLLAELATPSCVDENGKPTGSRVQANGTCTNGAPRFPAVTDIHLGIVSSSLGAHGGTVCSVPAPNQDPANTHLDDQAHLIATERTSITSWNNSGFLAWDPAGDKNTPPGEPVLDTLTTEFQAMIEATGQSGCGYESSLESWYRFLVDPEPPTSVTKQNDELVRSGLDETLRAQRAAFLRPDSIVGIVMLSDENDCSIRDEGLGWLVGTTTLMPRATAACAVNPNDPCCRSCDPVETTAPSGCTPLAQDPVCTGAAVPGGFNTWDGAHDSLNLRCFQQKQRFGFDLLYDTNRYVDALSKPMLPLQSNPAVMVTNPLFDAQGSGKAPRDPSLIFLAGIVGVPWQDLATADSLTSPTALTYLNAVELESQNRWPELVGDASVNPPAPPGDPFMIESIVARSGRNPNALMDIAPANSTNPNANTINGHEQNVPNNDDLQYACTFPLATPQVCAFDDLSCDCAATRNGDTSAVIAANSPICQPPSGGPAGTTQYFGKAYPGIRELSVLRDLKERAVVSSICPKSTVSANPSTDPNYGYNPAVSAIVSHVSEALKPRCLPRALPTDPNDPEATTCSVTEVQKAGSCDCSAPGRSAANAALAPAILKQLQASGACGVAGQPSCDASSFCMCQIDQETGADSDACIAGTEPKQAGFCYAQGTSAVVAACPSNEKQQLRFVTSGTTKTPADGAITLLSCP